MRPIWLEFNLALQVGSANAVLAQPIFTPTVSGDLRVDKFESRTFSASMMLEEGAFEPGSAVAEVHTLGAEPWVTPASASGTVRMTRGR